MIESAVARDGYDHALRAISDLGVGPGALALNVTYLVYGSFTIAIALALRASYGSALLLLALSGMATAGLGLEWLGWTAAGATPVAATSRHALSTDITFDAVHRLLALAVFLSSGLAAILVGRRHDAVVFAAGVLALVLLAVLALDLAEARGALERVLVVDLQVWVAVLSFRLLRPRALPFAARP